MDHDHRDVLIVGGGHAGAGVAAALAQLGFAGRIAIVGEEPHAPYERPPLSKEFLAGGRELERMLLRPAAFWAERGIVLLPGQRVMAVDPDAHTVRCEDGAIIGYGTLVWAAGGSARPLTCPGADLRGVHRIRSVTDTIALRDELSRATSAVVIGGGYIGLEAAATLATRLPRTTVIEAQDRLLARVAGPAISAFYRDLHASHGVAVRLRAAVARLDGDTDGQVAAVELADGKRLPADLVIVGIGIVPNIAPLAAAGARCDGGVLIDPAGRTSLPHVYAAGDCCAAPSRYADGETVRIESVQNANDGAVAVARAITGLEPAPVAVPWFWSNQYAAKLQTVGLSRGFDVEVVRGDPAGGRFSVVYLRAGRVVALDCVNRVRDYVDGRKLVERGARIAPALLADADRPLSSLEDLAG